jgi:hypothetical protein
MIKNFKVLLNGAAFLLLMTLLFWLMDPYIPGIHGFWKLILDFAGWLLFYCIAARISRSGSKKTSENAKL